MSTHQFYGRSAGILWIVLGAAKLLDPEVASQSLERLLASEPVVSRMIVVLMSLTELALGALLLGAPSARWLRWIAGASLALGAVYIVATLTTDFGRQCGCFGAVQAATEGKSLAVAGILSIASLMAMLVRDAHSADADGQRCVER